MCLEKNIHIIETILFKLFETKKNNRFKKIINSFYVLPNSINFCDYISQRVFGYIYSIKLIFRLSQQKNDFLNFIKENYFPSEGSLEDYLRVRYELRNDNFGNSNIIILLNNLFTNISIRFFIYINKYKSIFKLPIRFIYKEIDIIIESAITAFIVFKCDPTISKYLKCNYIIQKNINDIKAMHKDVDFILDDTIIILAFEYIKILFFNKKRIDQKILKILNKSIK